MVRHVVMFEFAKMTEGKTATQNAVTAKNMLLSLKDKMDFLQAIEVGINDGAADETNYTLCLTCDFESIEDLNRYAVHPEHLKVAAFIGRCKIGRACVDYEI